VSQQPLDAVSMRKGIASLLAQLNADHPGYRWRVASPPEGLEGSAVMGAGEVDLPRVGAPHDEHAIGNVRTSRPAANEHDADQSLEEAA